MTRRELAEKLLSAPPRTEKKRLLLENFSLADEKLALILKEICYELWTNEPVKTQSAELALKILLEVNPTPLIEAVSLWVSGIAELTRGKLESAVRRLEKSAAVFESNGGEREAADTRVARAIPLALLGRYAEAVESGEIALRIFTKHADKLAAAKIQMNLGNIVSRQERHREAKKYYLAARKLFAELSEVKWQTMAENGIAITYAALNDFRQSEKFYAAALASAKAARTLVTEAEIEAGIGNLSFFRGRFDRALEYLENSRRKYHELGMPHQTAVAELEIADVYLELNLINEALTIYEKAAESLRKLKMQGEEARARANLAKAALLVKDFSKAKKELKKARRLYALEHNPNGAAWVDLTEANLESTRRNYRQTLKILGANEIRQPRGENSRRQIYADWLRGETLRILRDSTAEKILRETHRRAVSREQTNIAQLCLNSLGSLARRKNDWRAAEKYFKKACKIIEKLRAPLPAEEFRMSFLAGKFAAFDSLTEIYLERNQTGKAFLSIEKSKARTLFESLNFLPPENKNSSKLERKLLDSREELNWFYSRLNRAETGETENLQTECQKLEKQIAELSRQINSLPANNFQPTGKFNLNLKKFRQTLGKDKILIEFVERGDSFSAFVIDNCKINFQANLANKNEIAELLENLHFQFGSLRFASEKFAAELKKRADFYLRKIGEKLLAPLEKLIGRRNLIVVPTGILQYLPFSALRVGDFYEIEKREITVAPSAAIWQFLNEKPMQKNLRALVFGYADERIPSVKTEIENLRKILDRPQIFAGERATIENFNKNADQFDVLHFACHGLFRPDNPLFSSLHLADGWLTVRDVCGRKLKANLVTLSACETGLSGVSAGDEILGLARGFLSAGANSLVLSLWTVNDWATSELMKDFYTNLQRGVSIAASLRLSQIKFIERGEHPYFWSPFILLGR